MAQADIGPLVPTETSGTELAARLRTSFEAIKTTHSGDNRPSYSAPGTMWLKTSTSPWALSMYTGQTDAHLISVNPQTGAVSLPTLSGDLRATGNLSISSGLNHSTITMNDSDNGARYIHNNSNLIGFQNTGQNWTFRVSDTGAVWTAQLGDLNTHIETRASAQGQAWANTRLPLTGGTMSGDLSITKSIPRYFLHYPNVKNASWVMDASGNLIWQDSGGQNHFYIGPGGNVWTQQLGDLNARIESRADAYAQNAINNANGKFENIRLTAFQYVSGNDFMTAASGYVLTGIRRDPGFSTSVHGAYIAQIQGFSPSRGWVAGYNQ